MTPRRHRRSEDEDGFEGQPHQRAEDRNPARRAVAFAERYKILWVIGMAVVSWFSVQIIQPLRQISAMVVEQKALAVRMTAAEETQRNMAATDKDMAATIKVLTKIACVRSISGNDRYVFGIDCTGLIVNGRVP